MKFGIALFLGMLIFGLAGYRPASAVTAELAKKCRAMAFKVYPAPLTGSKGNSAQLRQYYGECLSKNGDMPEPEPVKAASPSAPKGSTQQSK